MCKRRWCRHGEETAHLFVFVALCLQESSQFWDICFDPMQSLYVLCIVSLCSKCRIVSLWQNSIWNVNVIMARQGGLMSISFFFLLFYPKESKGHWVWPALLALFDFHFWLSTSTFFLFYLWVCAFFLFAWSALKKNTASSQISGIDPRDYIMS